MLLTMTERLHRAWKLLMLVGVLNGLIGLVIVFPVLTTRNTQLLVGIMLAVSAVVYIIYMFGFDKQTNSTVNFFQFVYRAVFATLIIMQHYEEGDGFAKLMAIFFGIDALITLAETHRLRGLRSLFIPFLLAGITSAVISIALALHLTGGDFTTIAALLAVTFFVRCGVLIYTALVAKAAVPRQYPQ